MKMMLPKMANIHVGFHVFSKDLTALFFLQRSERVSAKQGLPYWGDRQVPPTNWKFDHLPPGKNLPSGLPNTAVDSPIMQIFRGYSFPERDFYYQIYEDSRIYTPWKCQKTKGFLTLSGVKKRKIGLK